MESQQADVQEFSNESITVKVNKKPGCVVELDVRTTPTLLKPARSRAVKEVAKEVSFPGFRKGKAPDSIVLKEFPGQIAKKEQEIVANMAFQETQKIEKIPALLRDGKISYELKNYQADKGAEFVFQYETEPSLPEILPQEFKLKKVDRPEVSEDKIKETLRQIQFFFAQWTPVNDRVVQEGDFIILNVDVIEDNGQESRLFSDTRFEVAPKSMAKWMRDLVIGLNIGESKEGTSYPDEDIKPEEKAEFKPKNARITVKTIETPNAPELDDKLAQQLGVTTLSELHEKVTLLLNEQADNHVKEQEREQASEFLLNHYTFDLPRSLTEKEAQFRLRQLMEDPQFKIQWDSFNPDQRQTFVTTLIQNSEKAVRMFYLCRKIVQEAKLNITPNDLPRPPANFVEALLRPRSDMHFNQGSEMHQAEAYSRLVLEKAEDYIIAHATKAS